MYFHHTKAFVYQRFCQYVKCDPFDPFIKIWIFASSVSFLSWCSFSMGNELNTKLLSLFLIFSFYKNVVIIFSGGFDYGIRDLAQYHSFSFLFGLNSIVLHLIYFFYIQNWFCFLFFNLIRRYLINWSEYCLNSI